MINLLKAALLVTYALAVAALLGLLPPGPAGVAQNAALVLLAVHALELAVMFKYVRLYPGSLLASIGLTLLFGLLHWRPLARAAAKNSPHKS